jgi:2-polyprenyl-3-methyl-5-hydroxy-6-metoxy-1,4-benzoquinol methylase
MIDFGKTADDYRQHRQGFPPRFFERLQTMGILKAGIDALDIGTGTGTIARGMAQRGANVTATDIAAPLLEQAKALDDEAGVSITYRVAPAEDSGLPDGAFDLVTAGQCWHWFDRSKAAQEVKRLLRPQGYAVIAHLDWIPLAGNVVSATENLILQYNPSWVMSGGTGLYPAWLADLALADFMALETFSFDLPLFYTHEAWRGRIRASAGVKASLPAEEVARFDTDLQSLLANDFPDDPLPVPHRVWALVGKRG